MNYIILDLEWNNAYCKKKKGFINEIIEIGAVKLSDTFQMVETFSVLIKPKLGKKLHARVKELTNITNDDITHGIPFINAMTSFKKWVSDDENIILTWGDTDIRVLIENFLYLSSTTVVPFLSNYINLQKYAQAFLNIPTANQIGLSATAEKLGINPDSYLHHRALGDSMLTAEIFKKIYNRKMLESYTLVCDSAFYTKITFKPKAITDINSPLVDKTKMNCFCDNCGSECEKISDWNTINQSFRAIFYCKKCKRKIRFTIRFKEYYDRVDIKTSIVPFIEKKEIKSVTAVESNKEEAQELVEENI
ncbi:MAG: exonuclease domain-containing protein [Acutalibacteraceae bacterium]